MIPKVIHYCWFGGSPKSELIERCIRSWKKYCPDYQIIEWNESNYDIHQDPFLEKAYEAKKWAFVADYARIDILYRHGGIYLDTDVELISSLDAFLEYGFFAGFESDEYVAFGLGFGSRAGHPVLGDILHTYQNLAFPDSPLDLEGISCPRIQTESLKRFGLVCNNQNQVFGDCHVFSSEYFCPMSYSTGKTVITENTVSIHHYDMSWVTDSYRKAKAREWRLIQVFGPRWGKRVCSVVSFPSKLLEHRRNGTLSAYLSHLFYHQR